MYRQGDVLLIPTTIPGNLKKVPRENRLNILARGEATGHHHAIADPEAELLVTPDEAAELYLMVHGTEAVDLVHQEHATIPVPPGTYKVIGQREYTPEAPIRVTD